MLGQGVFPRLRLEYGESGGELGRAGVVTSAAIAATLVAGLGAAYAVRPPTVHLHGAVQGPLVIRHAETLVGGVVRGGIVVRADHVTLRHVTVVGGENGIDIEHADHVMLDHVRVLGVDPERDPRARRRRDDRQLLDLVAGKPARQRRPHLLLDGAADEHGLAAARSPARARGSRRTRRWST